MSEQKSDREKEKKKQANQWTRALLSLSLSSSHSLSLSLINVAIRTTHKLQFKYDFYAFLFALIGAHSLFHHRMYFSTEHIHAAIAAIPSQSNK